MLSAIGAVPLRHLHQELKPILGIVLVIHFCTLLIEPQARLCFLLLTPSHAPAPQMSFSHGIKTHKFRPFHVKRTEFSTSSFSSPPVVLLWRLLPFVDMALRSGRSPWHRHLWLAPLVAGTAWFATLTVLLLYWIAQGRPRLPMQSNPYIAYAILR